MSNSFHNLFKIVLQKQLLFLTGTIMIIATWYVQSFLMDHNRERISETQKYKTIVLANESTMSNELFKFQIYSLLRDKFKDSTAYLSFMNDFMIQHMKQMAAAKRDLRFLEDGTDSSQTIEKKYDDEIKEIIDLYNKINYSLTSTEYDNKLNEYKVYNVAFQYYGKVEMEYLKIKSTKIYIFSLILFIVGTILISLNKSKDYLESLKEKIHKK